MFRLLVTLGHAVLVQPLWPLHKEFTSILTICRQNYYTDKKHAIFIWTDRTTNQLPFQEWAGQAFMNIQQARSVGEKSEGSV